MTAVRRPLRRRPWASLAARLGPRLRALVALLALAAAGAPGVAAVTEGLLAAAAGRGPAITHIEDARQPGCPFVHPADCALCACAARLAGPEPVPVLAPVLDTAVPAPWARQEFWRAVAVAAAPARAPPAG